MTQGSTQMNQVPAPWTLQSRRRDTYPCTHHVLNVEARRAKSTVRRKKRISNTGIAPVREGAEQPSLGSLRSHLRALIGSGGTGEGIQPVQKPCGEVTVGHVVRAEHRAGEGSREDDGVGLRTVPPGPSSGL